MARHFMAGWLVLGVIVSSVGCGSDGSSGNGAAQTDGSLERNASLRQSVDLVGIWLGQAILDREAFDAFVNDMTDPTERSRIQEMARAFESISIAMEFRSDSTMEIEIEVVPADSPPVRESTLGTWKVESCDATSVNVRCTESLGDGRVEEQVLRYEISPDRNLITTEAPIGEELRPFRPRFEFERRIESKVAELPGETRTILR